MTYDIEHLFHFVTRHLHIFLGKYLFNYSIFSLGFCYFLAES